MVITFQEISKNPLLLEVDFLFLYNEQKAGY